MSPPSGALVLRNYPDDDALKHPENYSKALSFSPDIIPLYGAKVNHDALIHPTSWRGFTGMPIVGGDVNHVYIRGHGVGGPYVSTLRVFPSELILWPHVWAAMPPVPGPVMIRGGSAVGSYASEGPLHFRPPHTAGNAYSLVANVFKHDPINEPKSLQDYEPLPPHDPRRYGVDDLVSFLSKDTNITYYNVIVADPTLKHVSANTRLRMFGQSSVSVSFGIKWHNGTLPPDGLEVSLTDDHGKIAMRRTPLKSLSLEQQKFVFEPSYDGMLTLNIFSPAKKFFEPYSGLSLQVFASGPQRAGSSNLLGALNVIFDPHSTRNLRHASPSAIQLREYGNCRKDDDCHCPGKPKDCAVIPTTSPAATGWWFRDLPNDTNHFPRPAPPGVTPDIQPVGTDLTAPGLWNSLQDPNADYSKDNAIELVGGTDNYIFVRGHSTITDIDVQTRVFALLGSPLLHPKEYTTQGISAQTYNGSGTVGQQSIAVADSDQYYLFNKPFDIKAPPNPNPGSSGGPWLYQPHYCLVAEVRQKRKCSLVFPSWPSEQEDDFKTMQDFQSWIGTNPLVCYRNIGWVPCSPNPGEKCFTWQCWTRLVIPDSSFCTTFWSIIIECDNQIIPPGSKWTLTCDDNSIFPNGVCFGNVPICTETPVWGCHFTGATPGCAPTRLILSVTWCDGGRKIPPPCVKFKFAISEVSMLSPILHLAGEPHFGSDNWPFYVASKYPYIGNQPNPSPLPSFAKIGPNTWPYPGSPQSLVGQVALSAKVQ